MEDLKKLLGDALYAQVAEKLGETQVFLHKKDQKVLVDDGQLIPKHRLDEVIQQKKEMEKLVKQGEEDLKELRKAAEGNAQLTRQIETLQEQGKQAKADAEKREADTRKAFALKESLMNAGVGDPEARDLLALKFDASKVELDDKGRVKGFDEMLKPIKENKALAGMFGKEIFEGPRHAEGDPPSPVDLSAFGGKNPFARATRNIAQQVEVVKTNPALAEKLKAAAGV